MRLSRRALIKDGMMIVSAGMVMPAIFSRGVASAKAMSLDGARASLAASDRTLIVVQMAGGNDGLNTVIPYMDPLYRQMRPTLAVPENKVITIDGRLGLHPNLAPLKQLWDQGHMAIVEGVGYPNQSLSHFQAMDIWQTLDMNGNGSEGWLGKLVSGWVDQDGHPFKAMNIGTQTAQALASISRPVPTLTSTQSYRVAADPADPDRGNGRLQTLMKLYNSYPKTAPYAALLDTTALDAQEGGRQLHEAATNYHSTVQYPAGPFAAGLKVLAQAIVEGLGLRVGYVTLGGFDTHANQQTTHDTLMKTLADGLAAFYADLVQHSKADNVVVLTWSEFGRRVEENGSQGTDHGTAAPMFILGNPVNKGIFGEPPGLGNLDSAGNMKYTIDFRSVYATVLDRWLGASSKDVLGGSFGAQNFLPQP
ncbi:DUF1501 domain-containing protein [Ktedonosporobacter rubrisoli]|uniref:DUF1501 domain-containing protein n=1 Tax=Ktedonosporobacter rubrisoli TaxID=2509675 RepID=A0A4P6K1D0_KTERU|nr:DUF1501 domain-containing protein [Ktedonosporobacter rubrisoli]QBD81884.1 DUF1501 domain-containing protein [Ktedonosporobacter rubrisoli]